MSEIASLYVCTRCRHQERAPGICPACGVGSLKSPIAPAILKRRRSRLFSDLKKEPRESFERLTSRYPLLDAAIGGGFVEGSVTMLAGEPGIGKSTLARQLFDYALYASGEETLAQLVDSSLRLTMSDAMRFMHESDLPQILNECEQCVSPVLIIDSIQTMIGDVDCGDAGSVSQVRHCARELVNYAKRTNCAVLIIGHIAKDGSIAGPETMMHLIDTVIEFQFDDSGMRVLRTGKNRFGPSFGVNLFEMREDGLFIVPAPEIS